MRTARRVAFAITVIAALVPVCLGAMAVVGVWRIATHASRRERREALGRAAVAAAIDTATRNAGAYAVADRRLSTVHIPAQRRAS